MELVKVANSAHLVQVSVKLGTRAGHFLSFVEPLNFTQVLVKFKQRALTILRCHSLLTIEVGVLDWVVLMSSQVGCHRRAWRCCLRLVLMSTTHIGKL